jgi:hypothetical protein
MSIKIAVPVTLTDRDLALIAKALKVDASPRRFALLPKVLRLWAEVDLVEYYFLEASRVALPHTIGRYKRIARSATELAEAIDAVTEDNHHVLIALELGGGYRSLHAQEQRGHYIHTLAEQRVFLIELIRAVQSLRNMSKKRRGRPRNTVAYLVLSDVSSIFEWLTGHEARRQVDRKNSEEVGPFYDFAASIWPPVFASGLDGLSAAMKNWAGSKHKKSALIANIHSRQPSWRVFSR